MVFISLNIWPFNCFLLFHAPSKKVKLCQESPICRHSRKPEASGISRRCSEECGCTASLLLLLMIFTELFLPECFKYPEEFTTLQPLVSLVCVVLVSLQSCLQSWKTNIWCTKTSRCLRTKQVHLSDETSPLHTPPLHVENKPEVDSLPFFAQLWTLLAWLSRHFLWKRLMMLMPRSSVVGLVRPRAAENSSELYDCLDGEAHYHAAERWSIKCIPKGQFRVSACLLRSGWSSNCQVNIIAQRCETSLHASKPVQVSCFKSVSVVLCCNDTSCDRKVSHKNEHIRGWDGEQVLIPHHEAIWE